MPRIVLSAVALVALGLAGCAGGTGDRAPGDPLSVVAAFYPLQFVAESVGGDRVAVTNLVKPGVEPHDLELQPSQVAKIADADLVIYLRDFQPAVDDTVDQAADDTSLDVAEVDPLRARGRGPGARDPHVWLDPVRLSAIADRVAERLARLDPDHAADFRARADALKAQLAALDREYAAGLAHCARREIVTSHAAFGYLADRYHLEQVAVAGVSPEEEPSASHLADVAQLVRERHATTIFFETLVSPELAETLARETGTRAEKLDPIEGIEPGSSDSYVTLMRTNLRALQTGLGCP